MSSSMSGATLHSKEPNVNKATQIMKVDFLPSTSLTFPASGSVAASANWYMLIIQPATISEVWKKEVTTGKATATTVPSMLESSKAQATVVKIKYLDLDNLFFLEMGQI